MKHEGRTVWIVIVEPLQTVNKLKEHAGYTDGEGDTITGGLPLPIAHTDT